MGFNRLAKGKGNENGEQCLSSDVDVFKLLSPTQVVWETHVRAHVRAHVKAALV